VAGFAVLAGAGSIYAASSSAAPPTPSAQLSGGAAIGLKHETASAPSIQRSAVRPSSQQAGGQAHASKAAHLGQPAAAAAARAPSAHPASPQAKVQSKSVAAKPAAPPPVYRNPLRDLHKLLPERVDMGADFGGSGPIYAIGNGVVTNAMGNSAGWPGGGWITYRLTSGPAAGQQVFVAEDVRPAVHVGQHVTSGTVMAHMFVGSAGIETGWAMPDGSSAESQLPAAGGVSGGGPFPTRIGLNFDSMLIALGVKAGFGYTHSGGSGSVPAGYPTNWKSIQHK